MLKQFKKATIFTLLVLSIMTLSGAQRVFAYYEGQSWVDCKNRTEHVRKNIYGGGKTQGYMQLFKCDGNMIYTRTYRYVYAPSVVAIARSVNYQSVATGNYAAQSNMVYLWKGTCTRSEGRINGYYTSHSICRY